MIKTQLGQIISFHELRMTFIIDSKIKFVIRQMQKDKFIGKYVLDVLWGQPIKLIQVVSTSESHEY